MNKNTVLYSRASVIFLQFIANHLIPDHDARVFMSPKNPYEHKPGNWIIEIILGGFRSWDAEHFLHIAEHGYVYEHSLAFYPLYPMIIRVITKFLLFIGFSALFSFRELSILVAVLLNILFFLKSADVLGKLTQIVFKKQAITDMTILLFSINPASIFFTTAYTESLFSLLTFWTMLECIRNRYLIAIVPVTLSVACRSNGLINIGFLLFCGFQQNIKFISNRNLLNATKLTVKLILAVISPISVFIVIQIVNYNIFCIRYDPHMHDYIRLYGTRNRFVLAGNYHEHVSYWCLNKFPMSYGYVQMAYWNVGLLRYYKVQQIPNFLLASPVLYLFTVNIYDYFSSEMIKLRNQGLIQYLAGFFKPIQSTEQKLFIYVLHATGLVIICLLYVHIQVSTRFLASASPCFYWFSCKYLFKFTAKTDWMTICKSLKGKCWLTIWYLFYFIIGIVMFCNFLPWT